MSKHPCIGIDLGTATSEIAVWQDGAPLVLPDPDSPGRSPVVPSIVAVDRSGRLLVGESARAYVDLPGSGARQVKRRMGTGEQVALGGKAYRPEEISAQILRLLKSNAEQALGVTLQRAVLSVPANFGEAQRKATYDAARLAGLEVVRMINEPTAAALAFGVRNSQAEGQVVVFDFGGGTLDVTILEMMEGILEVKASYGDAQLGGKDFDQALADLLERRFRLAHPQAQASERARAELRSVAESVKTQLSRHPAVQAFCPNYAVEAGRPLDLEFEVTRREFEEAIRPLLERARKCLQTTLEKAKVQARSVGRVLLVGGTTYVPAVRALVAEIMGQEPRREVDPDLAVAQGAAIEAALIAGEIPSDQGLIKTDVTSFGLGVNVVGFVGLHMVNDLYDALIQPNTTLPYQVSKSYSLLHAEQKQVQLCLYQDHEGTAKRVVDAQATGLSAEIEDIPVSETGEPHPLEVDFSYDLNGLIQLRARIPTTGQEVALMTSRDGARSLDPADFAESKAKVDDLWSRSPLANRYEGLIRKAERMVPELRPDDRKKVHQATAALQEALASGDESRVEKAADRLTDLLFDLDGA
jgi:molecular chaperone DnaK